MKVKMVVNIALEKVDIQQKRSKNLKSHFQIDSAKMTIRKMHSC